MQYIEVDAQLQSNKAFYYHVSTITLAPRPSVRDRKKKLQSLSVMPFIDRKSWDLHKEDGKIILIIIIEGPYIY